MDQSELLSTLVVEGASVLLAFLLVRLALSLVLAALARVTLDPRRARRLAVWASWVAPRFARGTLVVVTGLGTIAGATTAATAAPERTPVVATVDRAAHVPLLDRGPSAGAAPTTPTTSVLPAPARERATRVVREGESLWSISADTLGPRASLRSVASAWPRWYAANRDVIGADPSRIRPGQVLRAPTAESAR